MSQRDSKRILEFMDWMRDTYQCPDHPDWPMSDWPMSIEPEFPVVKESVFGVSYILCCTAREHPSDEQCGYHIHVDDIRKISQMAEQRQQEPRTAILLPPRKANPFHVDPED